MALNGEGVTIKGRDWPVIWDPLYNFEMIWSNTLAVRISISLLTNQSFRR